MGPNSWRDLLDTIARETDKKEREAKLIKALGASRDEKCQACSQPFNEEHQSVKYVNSSGRTSYRCATMPNPDAVTEDDLAYVRRSILGQENT